MTLSSTSSKTLKILIIVGAVVVVGIIGFNLFRIFKGTPTLGPAPASVLEKPTKIGVIYLRQLAEGIPTFKEELVSLGYENVSYELVEVTPKEGEKVKETTRKFVEEGYDLIYTLFETIARDAFEVTREMNSDTPIIFLSQLHDPVRFGLAKSFKSSGNSVTGVTAHQTEIVQKFYEFSKRLKPNMKKIGVFTDGFMVPSVGDEFLAELKVQAPKFGVGEIIEYKTSVSSSNAESAWYEVAEKIQPGDIDAVFHIPGHFFNLQETAELALVSRLGIILTVTSFGDLENGGHFSYASDFATMGEQAGRMADKIFRGVSPSDIPIEYSAKNILMLNLKAAAESGVEFPESMLSIAEVIIE